MNLCSHVYGILQGVQDPVKHSLYLDHGHFVGRNDCVTGVYYPDTVTKIMHILPIKLVPIYIYIYILKVYIYIYLFKVLNIQTL